MRAVTWHGRHDVRVDTVPDPEIVNPRDAIIKVTSTAICGSDLHLYDGYIPGMRAGDILGHEFMGEVVEVGRRVDAQEGPAGGRPVHHLPAANASSARSSNSAPATTATRPKRPTRRNSMMGHPMGGAFGYAHLTGGYAGGQAEYVRVPYSDVGPVVIPDGLDDDKVLFLSDILPTGWQAAVNADIEPGDTVAVWGCGPVGLFAIQSALLLGAHRVIAIDHFPARLKLARELGAEILDYTRGRRPRGAGRDDRRDRPRRLHRLRRHGKPRPDASTMSSTRSRSQPSWRPTASTRCARRSWPAARADGCRSRASMAGSPTTSRSAS